MNIRVVFFLHFIFCLLPFFAKAQADKISEDEIIFNLSICAFDSTFGHEIKLKQFIYDWKSFKEMGYCDNILLFFDEISATEATRFELYHDSIFKNYYFTKSNLILIKDQLSHGKGELMMPNIVINRSSDLQYYTTRINLNTFILRLMQQFYFKNNASSESEMVKLLEAEINK